MHELWINEDSNEDLPQSVKDYYDKKLLYDHQIHMGFVDGKFRWGVKYMPWIRIQEKESLMERLTFNVEEIRKLVDGETLQNQSLKLGSRNYD